MPSSQVKDAPRVQGRAERRHLCLSRSAPVMMPAAVPPPPQRGTGDDDKRRRRDVDPGGGRGGRRDRRCIGSTAPQEQGTQREPDDPSHDGTSFAFTLLAGWTHQSAHPCDGRSVAAARRYLVGFRPHAHALPPRARMIAARSRTDPALSIKTGHGESVAGTEALPRKNQEAPTKMRNGCDADEKVTPLPRRPGFAHLRGEGNVASRRCPMIRKLFVALAILTLTTTPAFARGGGGGSHGGGGGFHGGGFHGAGSMGTGSMGTGSTGTGSTGTGSTGTGSTGTGSTASTASTGSASSGTSDSWGLYSASGFIPSSGIPSGSRRRTRPTSTRHR